MVYCENCYEEELKNPFIDELGSVFCNEKCFLESQEYRGELKLFEKYLGENNV